jgi:hypothetical protein
MALSHWIDCGSVRQLSSPVHHGHLNPGAQARIEPHGGPCSRRGRQQQVPQVTPEHPYRLFLRPLPEESTKVGLETGLHLHGPSPAHRLLEPRIRRASAVPDAGVRRDHTLARTEFTDCEVLVPL